MSFTDNGAPITACQSQPLVGASATCTLSYASGGTHTIVATYSGTDGFASSVSAGSERDRAITTGAVFDKVIWSNTVCPDGTNSDSHGQTCIGHL